MTTTNVNSLKKLRVNHGKTQQEIANMIKVSRQTYAKIERGEAELSLGAAVKLSEFFDKQVGEFISDETVNQKKFNAGKQQQIITNFIELSSFDGRVPKTKLAKLCYLLDFAWYYEHLESITGQKYIKQQFWPIGENFLNVIDYLENTEVIDINYTGQSKLVSNNLPVKRDLLSDEEFFLLKKIANKWRLKSTAEIVAFTHNQLPWGMTDELMQEVPYEFITQEEPENVY
jgi:DNA-binding XRE family transcriptional regulator